MFNVTYGIHTCDNVENVTGNTLARTAAVPWPLYSKLWVIIFKLLLQISSETVSRLVNDFRDDIYKKINKPHGNYKIGVL